jgi:hypothetical protein
MSDMGWFDKISEAQKFTRNYFQDGKYLVQIIEEKSTLGSNGPYFVSECEIVWAREGSKSKVGERCSFHVSIKPNTPALGNIKEHMEAVAFGIYGQKVNIDKKASMGIVGPDQPFKGKLAWVEVYTKPQQKNKEKDFTYHNWYHATKTDYEKLANIREAANLPPFDPRLPANAAPPADAAA